MRITDTMMKTNFLYNLNGNMLRMNRFQLQMSSNKQIINISDDPVGMITSMQSRNKISRLNQFTRNLEAAQDWLNQGDVAMREINEIIKNVYEKTIDASTDAKSAFVYYEDEYGNVARKELAPERAAFAEYIKQMRDQLVQAANVTLGEQYIFGGFNGKGAPFVVKDVYPPAIAGQVPTVAIGDWTIPNASTSASFTALEETDDHNGKIFELTYNNGKFTLTNTADATETYEAYYRAKDLAANEPVKLDFAGFGKMELANTGVVNGTDIDYQAAFDNITFELTNGKTAAEVLGAPANVSNEAITANLEVTSFNPEPRAVTALENYSLRYDGSAFVLSDGINEYRVDYKAKDLVAGHKLILNFEGVGKLNIDITQAIAESEFGNAFNLPTAFTLDAGTGVDPILAEKDVLFYNGVRMDTPPGDLAWDAEIVQVMEFWTGFGVKTDVTMIGCDLLNKGENNFYKVLDDLYKDLIAGGNADVINNHITKLQQRQNHLLGSIASIGGRSNRLELVASRYAEDELNYAGRISQVEDADMAEVIMHFKSAEAVYQLAMKTGSYIIQPSLVDYLR